MCSACPSQHRQGLTVELASEGESIKDWAWGSQAEKYACVHTHTCTSLMHEALHGVLLHGDCEMMACERVIEVITPRFGRAPSSRCSLSSVIFHTHRDRLG